MTIKLQTTKSANALMAVAIGLVAWACSGDPAEQTAPGTGGTASSGGSGGSTSGTGGAVTGGTAGQDSGGTGNTGAGGTGNTGSVGPGGTGGTGGEPPDGGGSGGAGTGGTPSGGGSSATGGMSGQDGGGTGGSTCQSPGASCGGGLTCCAPSTCMAGICMPPQDGGTGGTSGTGGAPSGGGTSATGGTGGTGSGAWSLCTSCSNSGNCAATVNNPETVFNGQACDISSIQSCNYCSKQVPGTLSCNGTIWYWTTTGTPGAPCLTSDGGTGGTGGTSGTGGTGGTGSGGTGGTGGSPQAFSCSSFTRDTSFPSGLDVTGDAWASSASDMYVVGYDYATSPSQGRIVHYNGSGWSLMTLPATSGTYVTINTIWGSSANDVWAGGVKLENFFYKGVLLHRVNQGSWVEEKVFSVTELSVVSIWGSDANNVYVVAGYAPAAGVEDVKIFKKNGASWDSMPLPSHTPPLKVKKLWGRNATDVYAAGGTQACVGSVCDWNGALLWHWNGSSWTDVSASIPFDVKVFGGLSGTNNQLIVVGAYGNQPNLKGVRLTTADLQNWTRFNSSVTEFESAAWMPHDGAGLVGGTVKPQQAGSARLSELSLGSWTEKSLDTVAMAVTSVFPVPGTNSVIVASYGENPDQGMVSTGICQ